MTGSDLAACRTLLRGGSRSFHAASLLLPGRVRHPATALYAFCRVADDLIDGAADPGAALARLHRRLDLIYLGRPFDHPADRAIERVVAAQRLPRFYMDHLLDGFAWDAEGRRYADFAALQEYAARVAGAVGATMALLMGVRDPAALARACDLGMAMQLTNIARDVGEDARAGRLYLPLDWLSEAGIDAAAFLGAPAFTPALGGVVRRLLAEADALYARADSGIAALPLACRPGIGAARRLYAAIGDRVARNGFDSVSVRARVGPAGKLALAGRSVLAAPYARQLSDAPPLPCALALVAAMPNATRAGRRGMTGQLVWLIELFGQLDQRQGVVARRGRLEA